MGSGSNGAGTATTNNGNDEDIADDGGDVPNRFCSLQFNCDGVSRQNCQSLIQNYQSMTSIGLEPIEYPENIDEHQTMRHIVLLILLLCSMFVVSNENLC